MSNGSIARGFVAAGSGQTGIRAEAQYSSQGLSCRW